MSVKNQKRSDDEWLALIRECQESGISKKDWCIQHGIPIKSFYNNTERLRKKGYRIPDAVPIRKQDIIPLELAVSPEYRGTAAVLEAGSFRIEIMNEAAGDTLRNIFLALEALC